MTATILMQDVMIEYRETGQRIRAVEGVTLTIARSEFACLVGPSGCGKSTLLNAIAGFVPVAGGSLTIEGRVPTPGDVDIGMVFQEYALFPWRTALRNVEFGLEDRRLPRAERRRRALEYLSVVGLAAFADAYPHQLSGGMRQRVAIARALAYDPPVLLMDEPFGALDALTRGGLQRLLADLYQQTQKTVVYVTHDVGEAVYLADRVFVFSSHPGRIRRGIDVGLPRPRVPTDPAFLALKTEITALLEGPDGAGTVTL